MWQKLKHRWNVQSGWDVAVILLVFACTGFSILYLKKIIYGWMEITAASPAWLRWTLAIIIILPLYQVVLLVWGWLLGKFDFFWAFEKRMIARLGGLFKKKQKS